MKKLNDTLQENTLKSAETENKSALQPYQHASEYLQDVIDMFQTPRIVVDEQLQHIEQRLKGTKAHIPFEDELNKYNLNKLERFCVFKIAYEHLFSSFGPSVKDVFRALHNAKLCNTDKVAQTVLKKESPIYTSKIIAVIRGICTIKNDMLDKLLGVEYFSKSGDLAPADKGIPQAEKSNSKPIDDILSPVDICNKLDDYIVGQEQAKEDISSAVYEHLLRCRLSAKDKIYLGKTNLLMIGPTGTGKTYLCSNLAKILNMPFYIADASQMTDTGYVGLSADSILTGLQSKIKDMNGTTFPPSIIYLDEIDKIAFKRQDNDVSGKSVQEEFLKLLESDTYTCGGERNRSAKQYDISNIMFIAGGAFSGLEKITAERTQEKKIGFSCENAQKSKAEITTADLEKYGFMPEFLGRFTKRTFLQDLNEQDLANILTNTKNNPLEQYRKIFKEAGILLKVPAKTITAIAKTALKNQSGARGLKTELSNILGSALFHCKKEGKKQYILKVSKI